MVLSVLNRWKPPQPGLNALGLSDEGACLVRVLRSGGRPRVVTCDFRPWADAQARADVVAALRRDHGLDRARCTTVLDERDYALVLTEAPEVPPDELRAAIRWRIKDLIDFHVDDAIVDVFDVPAEGAAGRARSLYVVAARREAVSARVDLLNGAGVNLSIVDIPEMAQRNLAALLPEDANGVLCLSLAESSGLITVSRGGEVCLARRLETGRSAFTPERDPLAQLDRLVLEVQRSLDYYDSYFRVGPVAGVVLAPSAASVAGLSGHLGASLAVPVRAMRIEELVDWQGGDLALAAGPCYAALGAALRDGEAPA